MFLLACGGRDTKPAKPAPGPGSAAIADAQPQPVDATWHLDRDKLSSDCKPYADALARLQGCANPTPAQLEARTHISQAFEDLVRTAASQAELDARDKYCRDNVEALQKQVAALGC